MRFLPDPRASASGQWSTILVCIVLGCVILDTAAVPVRLDGVLPVHDAAISNVTVSEATHFSHLGSTSEAAIHQNVARGRATKPKKGKGKAPAKSKTPAKPKTPKKKLEPWEKPVPAESTVTKKCKVPAGKSFFYSGTWPKAAEYSREKKLTMDVDAYPKGYVDLFSGRDGTPRMEAKRKVFSRRISTVYAKKAVGVVHVMVPWKEGPNPKRFFHEDEWPILKKRMSIGKITRIVQVNPDNFDETRDYDPKKEYGLSRRAADIDLDNVPWDVDLDVLAERWQQVHGEQK